MLSSSKFTRQAGRGEVLAGVHAAVRSRGRTPSYPGDMRVVCQVSSVVSDSCNHMDCSLQGSSTHDFSGKNTGTGCHLQGIFPTQGPNPGLPHCRWILYQLSHREAQEYWKIHWRRDRLPRSTSILVLPLWLSR